MKKIIAITMLFTLLISCSGDSSDPEVLSTENTISSFQLTLNGTLVDGIINQSSGQITFNLRGASVNSLTPSINYSNSASIWPSESLAQNFSTPVTYTVTAENGNTKQYTVTVINTPFSNDNTISKFQLTAGGNTIDGTIDQSTRQINFQISATDVSSLTPTITHAEYSTISPSADLVQDFSSPVTYTVTAEDGSIKSYTVTNTLSSAKSITNLSVTINGQEVNGTIDEATKIISLDVGKVDIRSLIPTIEISEHATISYQVGTSENFEDEVTYTVTAEDGSTNSYKVRVNWPTFDDNGFPSISYYYIGAETVIRGEFLDTNYGEKLYLSDGNSSYDLTVNNSFLYSQGTNIFSHVINIPNNVNTSVYKLYYKRGNTTIEHSTNFDIEADNVPIINSTNQQSYSYNDIMIITGENLTPAIMIPSNGSLYLINAPSSTYNYTLSSDKKQVQLKLGTFQLFPSYYGNQPEVKTILLIGENGRRGRSFDVTFN